MRTSVKTRRGFLALAVLLCVFAAAVCLTTHAYAAEDLGTAATITRSPARTQVKAPTAGSTIESLSAADIKSLYQAYLANYRDADADDLFTLKRNTLDGDGHLTTASVQEGLAFINFIRGTCGLGAVRLNSAYSRTSQAAVDYMSANHDAFVRQHGSPIDHTGITDNADAQTGAGRSNLSWTSEQNKSIAYMMMLFFTDDDDDNIAELGHRLNLLNPKLTQVGIGYVSGAHGSYLAVDVLSDDAIISTGAGVAPAAFVGGNFPVEILEQSKSRHDPWTVFLGTNYYTTASTAVTIASGGKTYRLARNANTAGDAFIPTGEYAAIGANGGGAINLYPGSFYRDNLADGDYGTLAGKTATVTITGLAGSAGGSATKTLTYDVTFFRLSDDILGTEVTMYRLYNPNSGEHFYTKSAAERSRLVALGWRYEGTGWIAPRRGTPVYRLYNPNAGDHHYTTDAAERANLLRAGWQNEGVGWYAGGNVPLYRQYNPNATSGTHNYTTDKTENDNLVRLGWQAEGVGWYGVRAK